VIHGVRFVGPIGLGIHEFEHSDVSITRRAGQTGVRFRADPPFALAALRELDPDRLVRNNCPHVTGSQGVTASVA
jgi:hypothetical protein